MRTLRQEAQRLNDKVVSFLSSADAIASGKEKGSVFEIERNVAIAHSWCDDLMGLIVRIEHTDNADIDDRELWEQSEKEIGELFNELCYVHKCLIGEKFASLHEIQKNLHDCKNMAMTVKKLLL